MRIPRLLICGFGSFPAAPRNPSGAVIESLVAQAFRPPGLRADYLTLPVAWARSSEALLDHLARSPADGVLLVGVAAESDQFRVETQACNRAACQRPDQDGAFWPSPVLEPGGPAMRAVTAPADTILHALLREGLPARSSEDAGDYLCNLVLYRVLARQAPAAGFLHVPQAREFSPTAPMPMASIEQAVRLAACAFAAAIWP